MTSTSYEFTADQNGVIGRLAMRMKVVGLVLMILGSFATVGAVISAEFPSGATVAALFQGAIVGVIGLWTFRASGWFGRVVATEGHDITNLMAALGELRRLYDLQFWLLLVLLLLAVLAAAGVLPVPPGADAPTTTAG